MGFLYAGEVISAMLKPLQDFIMTIIEPVLTAVMKIFGGMLMLIVQNVIEPMIKALTENIGYIITAVVIPFTKLLLMFMFAGISIVMMIVFKILAHISGQLLAGVLNLAMMPANFLEKNNFMIAVNNGLSNYALWMVFLMGVYYGLKSIFSHFGYESEEPWQIMVRVGGACVTILSSVDICRWGFKLYFELQEVIFRAFGISSNMKIDPNLFGQVLMESSFNALDPISQMIELLVLCVFVWETLKVAFRFVERQVVLMVFVVMAPLPLACSVAKPLRNYFVNWAKAFAGQFIVQATQIVGICLLFVIAKSKVYSGDMVPGNNLLQMLMMLSCLSLMAEANGFAQMFVGFELLGDLKGKGLEMVQGTVSGLTSATQGVTKAVANTAMKGASTMLSKGKSLKK